MQMAENHLSAQLNLNADFCSNHKHPFFPLIIFLPICSQGTRHRGLWLFMPFKMPPSPNPVTHFGCCPNCRLPQLGSLPRMRLHNCYLLQVKNQSAGKFLLSNTQKISLFPKDFKAVGVGGTRTWGRAYWNATGTFRISAENTYLELLPDVLKGSPVW